MARTYTFDGKGLTGRTRNIPVSFPAATQKPPHMPGVERMPNGKAKSGTTYQQPNPGKRGTKT